MYTRNYSVVMNTKENTFEIRRCIKFWQMISKSTQLISISSTVNKELQGIHTWESSSRVG